MSRSCQWSTALGRCPRAGCYESGPCAGFEDDEDETPRERPEIDPDRPPIDEPPL